MKRAWNSSFSAVALGQHLDRHRATEDPVLRPNDVSHAAVRDRLPVCVARRKRGPIPRHLPGVPPRARRESSRSHLLRSSQPFASATATPAVARGPCRRRIAPRDVVGPGSRRALRCPCRVCVYAATGTASVAGAVASSSLRISTSEATTPAAEMPAPTQNAAWKPLVRACGTASPDDTALSV